MAEYRFDEIAFNSKEKKKPTEEDKYAYIGLEHLDSGSLTVSRWGSDVAPTGEKLVMRKGDVLFGKRRAYQKKVAIAPFNGIFSAHGMVLRPKEEVVTKEFFPLFISSDAFLDEAIKISVGSLSPTINWNDLKELKFKLPTKEEQKRIAPLIWAVIDTKNAHRNLLAATDELVKARFVEMFGDSETNLCQWKQSKIGDNCFVTKLAGFEYTKFIKYQDSGDVVMVKAQNVKNGVLNEKDLSYISDEVSDSLPRSQLASDDVVMTYVGANIGDVAIIDNKHKYHLAPNVAKIRPDKKVYNSRFFMQMLMMKTDYIVRNSSETAKAALGMERIRNLIVFVPPLTLQNQFADFVAQVDKSKVAIQKALVQDQSLLNSLMREYLG